jgi:hypothetical protein
MRVCRQLAAAAVTVSRGLGADLLEGRREQVATLENKSRTPDQRSEGRVRVEEFFSTIYAKRKPLQTIF